MLTVSDVSHSYGGQDVLRGVTLRVDRGWRLAVVGPNGAGKTTLLRIIAGLETPDRGTVSRAGGVEVGHLRQDVAETRGHTVIEEVLRGAGSLRRLEARLRELETAIAARSGEPQARLLEEYGEVQSRYEHRGGYDVDIEARRILGGLGFDAGQMERDVGELSGGWMMRVALARLLLSGPDLLLLDEPTNHLDLGSVVWLEEFVRRYDGAVVVVAHDREFLDNVCDHVLELDAGQATLYTGDFASFVEQRRLRITQLVAARRSQDERVEQLRAFVDRFRYKKSKAKQAQAKLTHIRRIEAERVEVPEERTRRARFCFPDPPRAPRVVAELADVRKAFAADVVFDSVDLVVERGQRIALVGPNGAGKSTLLKLLAGVLTPDAGTIRVGGGVVAAYHAQHHLDILDGERTVFEEFRRSAEGMGRGSLPPRPLSSRGATGLDARRVLGAFLFAGDDVDKPVRVLSGGEKARLALAGLMARPANLLLLDEPTNHLDMTSRDVLEDALVAYGGTVVLVTHDRHLIRSVADTVVEVRDRSARVHPGGWDDYLQRLGLGDDRGAVGGVTAAAASDARTAASGAGAAEPAARTRRRRDAERRDHVHRATRILKAEVERVEQALAQAEGELAELTRALGDPDIYADGARVKDLVRRQGEARTRAADLMERWEEASIALERATDQAEAELG